ncbi:MAG: transposase [Saprospiraceae bacterium]
MKAKIVRKDVKALSLDNLTVWLKGKFKRFKDVREDNKSIKMEDGLLSGFAMFSLKDASLLFFNNKRSVRKENLKTVYKIENAPSDSGMRTLLDKVKVNQFKSVFKSLVCLLRKAGVWEEYEYFRGHIICSIDGVHHFSSEKVHCNQCLAYKKSNGVLEYRHYLLSGAIIHPDKKEVMPVVHEAIIRQDGTKKNDCERNAAKRLLPELRKQFPTEKVIIVEDALSSNGPHIVALQKEDFRYVIGAKPKGNKYLFELMNRMEKEGKVYKHEEQEGRWIHQYRYANDLPLNSDNRDIRVNFMDYREIDSSGKKEDKVFSWITDFKISKKTAYPIMKMGRSRWKIENENFNTLKNQGYHFEHNYGHGKESLCTVLALLMMLAFWVDQIQQGWNDFFKAAWVKEKSKIALWEAVRGKFYNFEVESMEMIYRLIIGTLKVKVTFYEDSG